MEATNNQTVSIFPLGNPGPTEWFSGEVHVQTLVAPEQMEGLYTVGQVTFSPCGRTNWHTHPIGQVLLVTEGKGWYQERGKPAQVLTQGTTVAIPKDVEHWHGASADSNMVHIAISNITDGSSVTWMTPVTDEEYAEVNKNN
ncbi:cupin domain-containing protein [Olivibacter sp. XZL3]|uniref:(R)-mandelonitrile lyase n=1 Tax=Olivibacter sp. XZL3 TaxID=1735116 RepID=UPI00106625AE|nr:cupin domain-containing protein [Olivibacter sp. XZL3]